MIVRACCHTIDPGGCHRNRKVDHSCARLAAVWPPLLRRHRRHNAKHGVDCDDRDASCHRRFGHWRWRFAPYRARCDPLLCFCWPRLRCSPPQPATLRSAAARSADWHRSLHSDARATVHRASASAAGPRAHFASERAFGLVLGSMSALAADRLLDFVAALKSTPALSLRFAAASVKRGPWVLPSGAARGPVFAIAPEPSCFAFLAAAAAQAAVRTFRPRDLESRRRRCGPVYLAAD